MSTPLCLRCRTAELAQDNVEPSITFYHCPTCGARYAREGSGPLVDAWLMPITLPLYCVLFERDPEDRAQGVAQHLASSLTADEKALMIADIERELAVPTQPLNEVLPGPAWEDPSREAKLRAFLRRFVDCLRRVEKLGKSGSP